MQVFKGLDSVVKENNSVLTVGTFDGVHLGHRYILEELKQLAQTNSQKSSLVTFDPHPKIVLDAYGTEHKKVLTTLDEKLELINQFNLDRVVVIEFTKAFANIRSEDFVEKILFHTIGFSDILIGYDHAFGKNREGSANSLNELSTKLGFGVKELTEFTNDKGMNFKSSNIRSLLAGGEVERACKLLGRPYSLWGTVKHGQGRGKALSYPTANLSHHKDKVVPAKGVYAVRVELEKRKFLGMMNIGSRPTFNDDCQTVTLEVNIFDFSEDIYGKEVRVEFVSKIRDEQKFENSNELISQLSEDKIKALNDLIFFKEA